MPPLPPSPYPQPGPIMPPLPMPPQPSPYPQPGPVMPPLPMPPQPSPYPQPGPVMPPLPMPPQPSPYPQPGPFKPHSNQFGNTLYSPFCSDSIKQLVSENGKYIFKTHGNTIAIYDPTGQIWMKRVADSEIGKICMQSDGNLIFYGTNGDIVWSTNISTPTNQFLLSKVVLENDGRLVIYNGPNAVWSSDTDHKHTPKPIERQSCIFPSGTWMDSCNVADAAYNGYSLYASCKNNAGYYMGTSLDLSSCAPHSVRNNNGKLECSPGSCTRTNYSPHRKFCDYPTSSWMKSCMTIRSSMEIVSECRM